MLYRAFAFSSVRVFSAVFNSFRDTLGTHCTILVHHFSRLPLGRLFHMRIYIDEAGLFVPPSTEPHSYSLVLALAIPSSIEGELFYEFLRLRDSWPIKGVEIKGSKLEESQAAGLIEVVSRYDVVVNFFAIDMATHGDVISGELKMRQAAELTAHLTPAHRPNVVAQLHRDADVIRAMPNQLFLQSFLTIQLVLEAIQETTLYYVQRLPEELGEFAWFIDPKDHTITQMEEMWTKYILPMGEGHFARKPLAVIEGADYSDFDARYTIAADDEETKRHREWMEQVYGLGLAGRRILRNANLLLSGNRTFPNSRDSLGIQLADMLAAILRRALNNHLRHAGWKDFGKLLVDKRRGESHFLQLGLVKGVPWTVQGYAKKVGLALMNLAKPMVLD